MCVVHTLWPRHGSHDLEISIHFILFSQYSTLWPIYIVIAVMKQFIALAVLACALCAVQGRQLQQQTLAQALQAAQGSRVSTLIAAVQVKADQQGLALSAHCCQYRSRTVAVVSGSLCK